ncbi:MAG: acylneuraminate cytidylyltransferase, partial [Rhodospirillales bacterium]|nr:acylneuraminate cytidylyltransferase [Rhodospirillales bacterium]
LGLGHVVRCLALAGALRDRHGAGVRFAVTDDLTAQLVTKADYPVDIKPGAADEDEWLLGLKERLRADVLVVDVRSDLAPSTLERAQVCGCLVAVIDDPSARRLVADLGFYPPVPEVFDLDWSGFQGTLHAGWGWVILRPQFAARRYSRQEIVGPAKVLIAMGGADPAGLSLRTVEGLIELGGKVELHVIVGAANRNLETLREQADLSGGLVTLHPNVEHMAGLMAEMDLAVAAFGVTAYELAALGVPAIYLSLTDQHASAATALVEAGAGISLGVHTDVTADALRSAVVSLIDSPELRASMAAAGPSLGLGQGARNAARILADEVVRRRIDTGVAP